MPALCREICAQEGLDDLTGQRRSNDPLPNAKDIHIVMLDTLRRGIGVVADPCPQTWMLVDGDTNPDAASADQDPSIRLAFHHGLRQEPGEIGIIVFAIVFEGPYVENLVAGFAEVTGDELFKLESGMISADCYLQGLPFLAPGRLFRSPTA